MFSYCIIATTVFLSAVSAQPNVVLSDPCRYCDTSDCCVLPATLPQGCQGQVNTTTGCKTPRPHPSFPNKDYAYPFKIQHQAMNVLGKKDEVFLSSHLNEWMGHVHNFRLLGELLIPGTHDTLTSVGSCNDGGASAQCQVDGLKLQLELGIRYFDLRFGGEGGSTYCYARHGPSRCGDDEQFGHIVIELRNFLSRFPTEVVILRYRLHEGGTSCPAKRTTGAWFNFGNLQANPHSISAYPWRDQPIGAVRGRVILLRDGYEDNPDAEGSPESTTGDLDQYKEMPVADRTTDCSSEKATAVVKWRCAKDTLDRMLAGSGSSANRWSRVFLSAAYNAYPQIISTGFDPTGVQFWYPLSNDYNAFDKSYYLFDPTEPNHALRPGTNARFQQYVFDERCMLRNARDKGVRAVGVVMMDFPGLGSVSAVVSQNFPSKTWKDWGLRPVQHALRTLFEKSKPTEQCVAGDASVLVRDGVTKKISQRSIRDVALGDDIIGRSHEACRVLSTVEFGTGNVSGEFTEEHLVWNASQNAVVPYSTTHDPSSSARVVDLINVVTSCALPELANGVAFTPFSTLFCDRTLTTAEYIGLFNAVLKVATTTGMFWFNPKSYQDWDTVSWKTPLPPLCESLLTCIGAPHSGGCTVFDEQAQLFVKHHLKPEYRNAAASRSSEGNLSSLFSRQGVVQSAAPLVLASVGHAALFFLLATALLM